MTSFPIAKKYLIIAIVLFLTFDTVAQSLDSNLTPSQPTCSICQQHIKPIQLNQSIHLAANYLLNNCDETGKFTYRINTNPNISINNKYNLLRHAGSLYALTMYEQRYPNGKTRYTLVRGAQFLHQMIAPLSIPQDILAVWSDPKITGSNSPLQAKLGGTGLGLVALASIEPIKPGTTPLKTLKKMGHFLLFMQKEDGSFSSKYVPSQGGKNDKWTSLYYPGEAALGLLMLYEQDPSPLWITGAVKALTYLAKIRAGKKIVEADHWALLATSKLLQINNRDLTQLKSIEKSTLLQHARQVAESILATKAKLPKTSIKYGSFMADGRTTPTATRLEGLLATLTFLPQENKLLRDRITTAVTEGLSFLLQTQIRVGKYAGGMPRAIVPTFPAQYSSVNKSFSPRATEVRIDYVQHALSAMIQFEQLFYHTSEDD